VLAIRAIRRRMRYEVWHVLHLSGYLVLLLSYGHQFADGADLVFRQELDSLAGQRGMRVVYVLGSRHDPGPRHLFTPDGLRDLVPDVARRDVYLCGPEGLISVAVKTLHRLKVPRRQIHLDPFEF
jgi:ferredoxin-NADP reductase